MMQPAFLPWQGFFELIYQSERFILLDDFQFSVQSYHQRNRLFSDKDRVDWYTVPVIKSASFKRPLNATQINEILPWRSKMLKRLAQNYSKAPYFREVFPRIETWITGSAESLASLNEGFIRIVLDLLRWDREILYSSSHPSALERSARVAELLQWAGAERYCCARGSFGYMQQDGLFPLPDVDVVFQDFLPQPYPQIGSPARFISHLSTLDALMNLGPADTAELIASGSPRWQTWAEMTGDAASVQPESVHRLNE